MPVLELGYLGLEVSDMQHWRRFASDVLGLTTEDGPPDNSGQPSTRLRMDQAPARILLLNGSADDCAFAGWRLQDVAAIKTFCTKLERLGLSWQQGLPQELSLRGVAAMVHFADPGGNRHEVYCGQKPASSHFHSPLVDQGFVTGAGGLGHVVYEVGDYAAHLAFARDVLELRLSDTILADPAPGVEIEIAFFHANERHHSYAIAPKPPRPGPSKRVHHFMLEVHDITDVGRARDRCLALDQPVTMDIGEHPNDRMVSFYVQTPSGIHVEYGCNGVRIDDATWVPQVYRGTNLWGHSACIPNPQHHDTKLSTP
jgi:2,3-dihydroxybiphenyl 1,2-dioxygenase